MNKYFRIKGQNPKDNYSFIIDSNGTFEKLWQFSAYLVQKGLKIIEVYSNENVDDSFPKLPENTEQLYLRACWKGKQGRA